MGLTPVRSRFSTAASAVTANRYPASWSRQHRSTSSPGESSSQKPCTASKTSLRTAKLAPRAKGRNPNCRVAAGTGIDCRDPVQGAEVEHPGDQIGVGQGRRHGGEPTWPHHVVGVTEGQEAATGRPDPDVASRRRPSTRRGVHQVDVRVPLGPPQHTGTGPIVGAVVGHHHFPVDLNLLGGQGPELVLDPRHAVLDRHHHADQRGFARLLLVRHPDVLHDRC